MLFNSIEFLILFLPATLALYYALRSWVPGAEFHWLVTASLMFYAAWEPRYLVLLLGSAAINYLMGNVLLAAGSGGKRWLLALGIGFNLVLLGYYKYAAFAVENLAVLFGVDLTPPPIVLPLAISFFTFQQIAYLVDVSRHGVVERSPMRYLLFVTFFPQLIAGPIVHHSEMMPQFRQRSSIAPHAFAATCLIVIGLSKKLLVADTLAAFVDPIFTAQSAGAAVSGLEAWVATLGYTLQLYFDFSGYCDIAMGVALLFGIKLPVNFASPLKAASIIEFWRLWHMTLSRFLRDYLYIPLGGNRRGKLRRYINLLLTMLLGGLWHGANWTFVVWGGIHGLMLCINHLWRFVVGDRRVGVPSALSQFLGWLLTFSGVVLAFVFFRSATVEQGWSLITALVNFAEFTPGQAYIADVSRVLEGDLWGIVLVYMTLGQLAVVLVASALFVAGLAPSSLQLVNAQSHGFDIGNYPKPVIDLRLKESFLSVLLVALLAWLSLNSLTRLSPFLYFQF